MDWVDVAKTAADAGLHMIGTALAGSAGSEVASSLSSALGLAPDAKPEDVKSAITNADPATMIKLKSIEADIVKAKINLQATESTNFASIQESLAKADASGASTRPAIAKNMSDLLIVESIGITATVIIAVFVRPGAIKDLSQAWPLIAPFITAQVTIIYQYFGKRSKDKQARYNLAAGQPTAAASGLFSTVAGMISGKKQ